MNEEWISDKARFVVDGLKRQRLLSPFARTELGLQQTSWEDALFTAAQKLRRNTGSSVAGIVGGLVDVGEWVQTDHTSAAESLVVLKDLLNRVDSELFFTEESFSGNTDLRADYLLNDSLVSVEAADAILLVGTNPRYEAPVFNSRIRKTFLHSDVEIGVLGSQVDLTYDYTYLGDNTSALDNILAGTSDFAKVKKGFEWLIPLLQKLAAAQNPVIIVGADALVGDGGKLLGQLKNLAAKLRSAGGKGYEKGHGLVQQRTPSSTCCIGMRAKSAHWTWATRAWTS